MSGAARRWLLIGNSRWHWAVDRGDGLSIDHELPPLAALEPGLLADLVGWAAVGALPPPVLLPSQRRLQLDRVPLVGVPPWLGLDRALAGWLAWRRRRLVKPWRRLLTPGRPAALAAERRAARRCARV